MFNRPSISKKRQAMSTTNTVPLFDRWARVTGLHGALDFHHAHTLLLKIIWALVILLGCFFAINQTIMLVNDYTSNGQWLTSVSHVPDKSGMIPWPNFTLCNLNWLYNPRLVELKLSHQALAYELNFEDGIDYYQRFQADNTTDYANSTEKLERAKQNFIGYMESHQNLSLVELRNARLAQNCQETIMRCGSSTKFNLEADTLSCCNDASPSAAVGCFQVNPQIASKSKKPGYENGIYFILDAKALADYPLLTMGEKPSAGFSVELYFGDNEGDGMNPHVHVAPSTHTVISLVAEKRIVDVRRLLTIQYYLVSEPCVRTPNYTYLDYDYSAKHCRDDCMAKYFIESIGCTGQTLKLKNTTRRCSGTKIIEYHSFYKNMAKGYSSDQVPLTREGFNLTQCYVGCAEACESVSVSATVSSAGFPAPMKAASFYRYIEHAANRKDFQNLTLLEFYYESSHYRVITKMTRTTVDELISDIGGSLGVWTGISIITIFEVFVYLFYATDRYCRMKKSQEQVRRLSSVNRVSPAWPGRSNSDINAARARRVRKVQIDDGTAVTEVS